MEKRKSLIKPPINGFGIDEVTHTDKEGEETVAYDVTGIQMLGDKGDDCSRFKTLKEAQELHRSLAFDQDPETL
jgi:hypothetical protein